MTLGVNAWRIHGQRTGVGRYLLNVVRHWSKERLVGCFSEVNFYTPRPVDRQEIPLPDGIRPRVLAPERRLLVWENLQLGPAAKDEVLFCPSYTRPLYVRGRAVVTTHDATSKLYPELFPVSVRFLYNPLYGWSARRAALVITDSEASRQDIARCWGVPVSRIRVVYLAPADAFRPDARAQADGDLRDRYLGSAASPFFLFVGKLSGRRNIPLLLEAFAEFKRRARSPHKLLIVGLNIHGMNLGSVIDALGVANDVRHSGYVSDEDLNRLYNAADALLSPATYETVSLPVMEAQATGTPVVCIDTAGMREITGGAAVFLKELGVHQMAEAMTALAADPGLRRDIGERGYRHSRRFSWERCSAETLAVLQEAARLPRRAASAPLPVRG